MKYVPKLSDNYEAIIQEKFKERRVNDVDFIDVKDIKKTDLFSHHIDFHGLGL